MIVILDVDALASNRVETVRVSRKASKTVTVIFV
jgi:hypothetical protein